MSRGRSYWAGLERPIAWCSMPGCGARGAREGKDGRRLCPACRAALPSPAQLRILRFTADPSLPWRPGGGYFEALAACERRGWVLREQVAQYCYRHVLSADGKEALRRAEALEAVAIAGAAGRPG